MLRSRIALRGGIATVAMLIAGASTAALADRDDIQPRNITVSFGEWKIIPPFDRNDPATSAPITANNHEIIPHEINIRAGDSINFIISGFHQVQIYEGVSAAELKVLAAQAPRVDGILYDVPGGRIYRGLNPNDLNVTDAGSPRPAPGTPPVRTLRRTTDRIEVVKFTRPGEYLVACAVSPHFLADNMYARIRVIAVDRD